MLPEVSCRWRIVGPEQLVWRLLDADWLVFNPNSGDTHLLNEVAAQALRAMEQGCLSLGELTGQVAQVLDVKVDQRFSESVTRLLSDFEELGLVEAIPP